MDKKAIKTFAMESRMKLRDSVINKLAKLGITDSGIEEVTKIGNDIIEIPSNGERFTGKDVINRTKLVEVLNSREKQIDPKEKTRVTIAFDNLVEEVSYTWFNRLIAIRFMEINGYLPGHQRVLSSEVVGKKEPDIITSLLDSELYQEMDAATQGKAMKLISVNSADAVDELYQLVFIKQCNSLNQLLPDLFEHIDDYTELLFTISYIDDNGVLANLLTIPEEDFNVEKGGQVEIIGWMYQYYNTEPKDKVFARGHRKIRADEIPAATQLFTPDWIVRYMVQNSLGRYYIDQKMANPAETRTEKEIAAEFGWKYYLPTAEQPEDVQLKIADERKNRSVIALQELKLIDLSMGSGHILVYAFDVLIQLYIAEGYRKRDAAELILMNNLYGLDIDKRAFQLSYFALMMKGRQYSRRILFKDIKLNVYAVPDNLGIGETELQLLNMEFPNQQTAHQDLLRLVDGFKDGADLGSLIEFKGINFDNLKAGFDKGTVSFLNHAISKMVHVGELLQQKYDIGITNPPYMSSSSMNKELSNFVKKNYPDSKSDLFGVFIERIEKMVKSSGYYAMITQHAWMFLSSFEKLRGKINRQTIINMTHLGTHAFEEIGGEVVQTTAFVMSPLKYKNYVGSYLRLVDFTNHKLKETKVLEAIEAGNADYFYSTIQNNFTKIPGQPISYWVSENLIHDFIVGKQLGNMADVKKGMFTGQNDLFFRQWTEPSFNKIQFDVCNNAEIQKEGYIPINKGGDFRRWYGNDEFVMKFDSIHYRMIESNKGHRSPYFYFKPCVEWTKITSGKLALRYSESGFVNNDASMAIYSDDDSLLKKILGITNTKVSQLCVSALNESMNYTAGDIARIPIIFTNQDNAISAIANKCIELSQLDWNSYEISWNFNRHPLI
ncbi:BREX-1 system adenine-specific DNA-methyltransferase PglX [Liquorilactobacillus hordei]|uniref:site-specific DNA-methyltransferase (adenine-specific) n=1 Tax=Liquorilactobacillus hordei DSM 19519 TaxID=1423759 RepID=A0A0R1M7K4_9LACO|nr:BREX-1 system adenine-specific DNA-methyltransferase PglX [Liquorilactobacillus hordei]KRL03905.1 restriction enzyme [Liquorilactobacillus hordei DSM 19519]QYH52385.1 BREX-1 system adenine-specific DNA-methyltransferase PglX [Liquorilactobacillus hordei DSM 19519]